MRVYFSQVVARSGERVYTCTVEEGINCQVSTLKV